MEWLSQFPRLSSTSPKALAWRFVLFFSRFIVGSSVAVFRCFRLITLLCFDQHLWDLPLHCYASIWHRWDLPLYLVCFDLACMVSVSCSESVGVGVGVIVCVWVSVGADDCVSVRVWRSMCMRVSYVWSGAWREMRGAMEACVVRGATFGFTLFCDKRVPSVPASNGLNRLGCPDLWEESPSHSSACTTSVHRLIRRGWVGFLR
jgi:hypothetical protein